MADISDLTALVTARFLAASTSADEFNLACDRALASFGAVIAGAAIERCMRSGTPQGEAVWSYAITGSMAAREDVPRDHPTPQPPKPQLRIIDGGRS